MKILLLIGFITIMNNSFGQKLTKELEFAKAFLDDMRNGKDVRPYLSPKFIKQNQLEDTDWQSNYFLIKHFTIAQITEVDKMIIYVEVDHGSGDFCTSFELVLVNDEGNLKILPIIFSYNEKIKRHIVTPWRNKKKLC